MEIIELTSPLSAQQVADLLVLMPLPYRAYPLPLEQKAAAYRQLFH